MEQKPLAPESIETIRFLRFERIPKHIYHQRHLVPFAPVNRV